MIFSEAKFHPVIGIWTVVKMIYNLLCSYYFHDFGDCWKYAYWSVIASSCRMTRFKNWCNDRALLGFREGTSIYGFVNNHVIIVSLLGSGANSGRCWVSYWVSQKKQCLSCLGGITKKRKKRGIY